MSILKTTETIKSIQEAQRSGRPKQTYTISLTDVIEDYNRLLKEYYNVQNLSSAQLQELKTECSTFYNLVEKQARSYNSLPSKEQSKLYEVFISVKKINKNLAQISPQNQNGND